MAKNHNLQWDNAKFLQIYNSLLQRYDMPEKTWTIWRKKNKTSRDREEIALGAILAQATNWRNAETALENLKKQNKCLIQGVYKIGKKNIKKLEKIVKPSGFYKQKAERIFLFSKFIIENYGSLTNFLKQGTQESREQLLKISGIGPETADSILLYSGDKMIFVIDEYTRRFVKKYQISNKFSYDELQKLFQKNLPKDIGIYQNFHALIVSHGKEN